MQEAQQSQTAKKPSAFLKVCKANFPVSRVKAVDRGGREERGSQSHVRGAKRDLKAACARDEWREDVWKKALGKHLGRKAEAREALPED